MRKPNLFALQARRLRFVQERKLRRRPCEAMREVARGSARLTTLAGHQWALTQDAAALDARAEPRPALRAEPRPGFR
jgi:hypothetical protein